MSAEQIREFEPLVSALCDGVIEPQPLQRLEQLLRDSAECRQFYLEYVDMHARLNVHPNLATGIPIEAVAEVQDDEIVLELARTSLGHFANEVERGRKRRKLVLLGRWVALTLAILLGVGAWQFRDGFPDDGRRLVIRELVGEATIQDGEEWSVAQVGDRLRRGARLRVGEDDAHAVLEYDDGTRIVAYFNSVVEIPAGAGDGQVRLLSGTMEVDAAPQPAQRPLVFATDHARYVVLGTRFRLYRDAHESRLELDEGKVRLERRVDGESVEVTAGHVAVANAAASPLEVLPLAAGRSQLRSTLPKAGQAVAFSPDANVLATADWERGLRTWRPDETTPQQSYQAKIGRSFGLAFTDRGLVQVDANGKRGTVTLWSPGDAKAKTIKLSGGSARSRALSFDGRFVAESGEDGTRVYQIDASRRRLQAYAELPDKGKAWCLALSRSAEFAAAGFWDGTVRVYRVSPQNDAAAGSRVSIVFETRLTHTPTEIALSADGDMLAVFTQRDGLLLIDPATGQKRLLWAAGAARAACAKFTADGRRLIAGMNDRTARMWSVDDGRALIVIDAGHTPKDVAWSAEHSLFATAGGQVKLWDCEMP